MYDPVEQALLFDFYGELLTEQQRKIYQEVYFEDYSPSEVADGEHITRQGVHDMLRRTQKALDEYEARLGLVERSKKLREISDSIEKAAGALAGGDAGALDRIRESCERLRSF